MPWASLAEVSARGPVVEREKNTKKRILTSVYSTCLGTANMGSHVNPPLSYSEALAKIDAVALSQKCRHVAVESLPLEQAVGRVAACENLSPVSTPRHDTSAMDGFAIRSKDTASASPQNPTRFRVRPETVAAGDDPGLMRGHAVCEGDEEPICVEITTGGIFPVGFDACVRFEDTEEEIPPLSLPHHVDAIERERYILVRKPIPSSANRRFAGSDIHKGQMLLREGESITLAHVLPLAAAGYTSISVNRPPRIAIISTGNELLSRKSQVSPEHDINGPYLTAAARSFGFEAEFLGTAADSASSLGQALQTAMHSKKNYDVVVTSGGISQGRYDLVRPVLEDLEA
jgi:molybdopterin molybdotransferase